MTISLAHVTFDCHDVALVSSFWSAALGKPLDDGASEFFATIGYPSSPGEPTFMFIQVPEGKTAKNRMHLDTVASDDGGRDAEVERLVGLGANKVGEHDEWGHQWVVMNDPEGNEFCVS